MYIKPLCTLHLYAHQVASHCRPQSTDGNRCISASYVVDLSRAGTATALVTTNLLASDTEVDAVSAETRPDADYIEGTGARDLNVGELMMVRQSRPCARIVVRACIENDS
jgi:hypothetical protein